MKTPPKFSPIPESAERLREVLNALTATCANEVFRLEALVCEDGYRLVLTCSNQLKEDAVGEVIVSELQIGLLRKAMAKPVEYHPMSKHPRGGRQVLVYSCYEQWIVATYEEVDGRYQWFDEEGRINNEKLWHYVWTELEEE
jgi:hypothetical protein